MCVYEEKDKMKRKIKAFAVLVSFMAAVFVMGGLYKVMAAESSLAEFNFDASGKMTGDKLAEYGDKDGYNSTYGRGTLLCYMDNSGPRALEWSDPEYNYNGATIVPIVRASIKNKWGNTPSFLISLSTKGYTSVRFSAMLAGSSNGPARWKLQYSTDGVNFTDISASDITIPFDTRKQMTPYYNGFAMPQEVSDRDIVYIRIIASSTDTVAGGNYLQLPSGGETAINGIRIVGTDIASITTAPPPAVTTAKETTGAVQPNTTKGQQTTTKGQQVTTKGQQVTTKGQQATTKTGTSGGNDATTVSPGNNGTGGETVKPNAEVSTHIVTQTNASGETVTSIVYDETTEALTDENGEAITDNESETAEKSEKESPDEKKVSKKNKKTATSGNIDSNNEGTTKKNGNGFIVISLLAVVLAAGIAAAVIIPKKKSSSDE